MLSTVTLNNLDPGGGGGGGEPGGGGAQLPVSFAGRPLAANGKPTTCCCDNATYQSDCFPRDYRLPGPCYPGSVSVPGQPDGGWWYVHSCLCQMGLYLELEFENSPACTEGGFRCGDSKLTGHYLIRYPVSANLSSPCPCVVQEGSGSSTGDDESADDSCLSLAEQMEQRINSLYVDFEGKRVICCTSSIPAGRPAHYHYGCCNLLSTCGPLTWSTWDYLDACPGSNNVDLSTNMSGIAFYVHDANHDADNIQPANWGLVGEIPILDVEDPWVDLGPFVTVELDRFYCHSCFQCRPVGGRAVFFGPPSCGLDDDDLCLTPPVPSYTVAESSIECRWDITSINLGTANCGAAKVLWSDGNPEGADRTEIYFGDGCSGTIDRTIYLIVIDTRGCVGRYGINLECGCDCPGAGGSLSVSQNGCELTITASLSGDCGATIVWHVRGGSGTTDCFDRICDDPLLCTNGGIFTTNGEQATVSICADATVYYQVFECWCRCAIGDLQELGPYTCGGCDCCSGFIKGINITVSGIGDGGNDCCGCECVAVNQPFFVPVSGADGCVGSKTFVGAVPCTSNPLNLTLDWEVWCEPSATPDHTDYYLYLSGSIGEENGRNVADDVYIGTYPNGDPPPCSDFSGAVTGGPYTIGDEDLVCGGTMSLTADAPTPC